MCTIVNARVPAEEFALQDAFQETPRARFETVRTAGHDSGEPIPFLRATAPDADAMETAVRADPTTNTVQRFSRMDEYRLYRIEWESGTRSRLGTLIEGEGTLLEATASGGYWTFELLFPDRSAASRTYDRCQDRGIALTVRQVTNDTDLMDGDGNSLSKEQHEALLTAFRTDYYRVPRGVTQVELAEKLDLSHQALSERLRRGHQGLISYTLCQDPIQNVP
jgi:predicted DNA binding protein